ncbi:unnamed protein product [Chondrus crispus]|uniref:Uncharacterized protein n=1 Tax=Chondrus crispus TaxID=2769 RepID=R7QIN1_CHOCR|nr:unnamed protein product [Chondrus crispus]CDF37929.1 unnamed protein product [Chondrus crispus]|eukprot:XP_005717800.1 unnamed protein product [Chondrus crispus]
MDPMQPFMRPPSREELRAVLKANAAFLAIYFTAIRATPLALDFAYAAYSHYSN